MLTVKDIMTASPVTVTPNTEIVQAAKLLLENRINGLPVVDDDGKLVGIICQSDLIAQQKKIPLPSLFTLLDGFIPLKSTKQFDRELDKIAAITVAQAMTPEPYTVTPDTTLEEVATIMVNRNFHSVPVLSDGRLVGIVGKEDILATLVPS